ncbi:unnamed protein product [Caenorhabditis nigoni]
MSSTPRSSLKKRPGNPDDRRVSFATPLSSDQVVDPSVNKLVENTKNAKLNQPLTKKSKPADDLVDFISLANKQSEVVQKISELESKITKQSAMAKDLTSQLTNFIELIGNVSSSQTRVKSRLEEQSTKLASTEENIAGLVAKADSMCKTFEERKTARAEYSAGLTELQAAIGYVNCKSIENTTKPIGEYVKMLEIVSKIEALVDRF